MYIWEVPVSSEMTIEIKMEDHIPIKSKGLVKMVSQKGKCVFLDPLRQDNKILKFDSTNLIISAIYLENNLPVIFKGCSLQTIVYKGTNLHALVCHNNGVNQNRRNHFRIPVDEYCFINNGKATVDGSIVNISSNGLAFVVSKWDNNPMEGVVISYHDSLLGCDLTISGKVIRIEPRPENRTLFGCRIKLNSKIEKYVNERQRKLIQMHKS